MPIERFHPRLDAIVRLGTIEERTSDMAWGDADWRTPYFTGARSLTRFRLRIPGAPVPRGAVIPASS